MEQLDAERDVEARLSAAQEAIESLRAEVAELRREQRSGLMSPSAVGAEPLVSRRALFGLAGAGIAGVALGGGASPAGAADGDPVLLGQTNTSTSYTSIESSGDDLTLLVENPGYKALWSISHGDGGIGVDGAATGRGGMGVLGHANGDDGLGVIGDATGGTGGIGVVGLGEIGVAAHSEVGSQLRLVREGDGELVGPPSPESHHDVGEISLDSRGDLFLCTASGTPGTWVRLNGQGAGFLPTAERAFDSREGRQPLSGGAAKGLFAAKGTRTIDLTAATGLPTAARAAIVNLTVTQTVRVGYLSVYPGDVAVPDQPTFSHINWTTSGQTIANTTTVTVTDGKVTVYAAQPTHVVIDVIGWYP